MPTQIIEEKPTTRISGTSENCFRIGDGNANSIIEIKANVPGDINPSLKFIPGTGWMFNNDGADGNDTGLGATAVIENTIANGVTAKAPSQNAVFDALALKAVSTSTITTENADSTTTANASFVTLADASTAPATYTQIHSKELTDLVNDMKGKYNQMVTLVNEIKSDYNQARTLLNEVKSTLNTMNA